MSHRGASFLITYNLFSALELKRPECAAYKELYHYTRNINAGQFDREGKRYCDYSKYAKVSASKI